MSIFRMIVFGMPLLNLIWWFWADGQLRRNGYRARWRWLLAAVALATLAIYAGLIAGRVLRIGPMPVWVVSYAYVWHLIILPITVVLLTTETWSRWFRRAWRAFRSVWRSPADQASIQTPAPPGPPPAAAENRPTAVEIAAPPARLTRRALLAGTLAAAAPVVALGATARALATRGNFRVRYIDVPIATLPAALDGLTIAHVSDTHVGQFTRGATLRAIADATNELRCDLVLFTGDLIDFSLDQLPDALAMLRNIDPRAGLVICEGNHDLFDGRAAFEQGVRAGGFDLLLDETRVIELRGVPVSLLGQAWGRSGMNRWPRPFPQAKRAKTDAERAAFEILVAHHPLAFDDAKAAGIPLTLAGHTHGGQLMLTENIGAGPMLFKHWSGLYQEDGAALVVSNGAGNWFPLRVNAPAEIIKLTLRRLA